MSLTPLSEPCTIAGLALANRLVMAPMTRSRSPGGVADEAVAAYYARRARAGVGLIITEGTAIGRPGAVADPDVPHFHGDAALAGWRNIAAAVHAAGGRIVPRLWHVGVYPGRNSGWADTDQRIESPSGLAAAGSPMGEAMGEVAVRETIAAFAAAAAEAEGLGFDGVEVHGAHGYLIDQFIWHETNRRSDRYGGSTAGARTRFAVEVVAAIRAAVAPTFPILFRFSQFKQQDYGARLADTPAELAALLEPLAAAGVDVFHASQRRFWEPAFADSSLNLAGWAKHVTGKPAITVGSIGLSSDYKGNWDGEASRPASIDAVVERLVRGESDLVAVGRALLNDFAWAEKMAAGRHDELAAFSLDALNRYY